jgi:hypothetical protein
MRLVAVVGAGLVIAVAAGCGGESSSPSGTGSLNVMLKDSPYSDAKSLLVTFSDVSVHRDDQAEDAWTKLPFASGATARTCDLKKLVTSQDVLGVGALQAGHYTQIRLTVSSAALYFDNVASGAACADTIAAPAGSSASVDVPSAVVKLTREFTVPTGGSTTIVLDFDGDKSINQTGNGRYTMAPPVITVVSVS